MKMSHPLSTTHKYTFSFLVDQRRTKKSTTQAFYIIPTDTIIDYQLQIVLTGSCGNKYKLTFTIDSISCTCVDFKKTSTTSPLKLCKHILFILKQLNFHLQCGIHHFCPDEILSKLETYSLSKYYLNNKTSTLCKISPCS